MSFKFRSSNKDRAGAKFIDMILRDMINAAIEEKKRSGVTRSAIADRLGVNKSQVSRMLTGQANLTLRSVGEFYDAIDWEPTLTSAPKEREACNHASKWEVRTRQPEALPVSNANRGRTSTNHSTSTFSQTHVH